jgi:hypothetical protein
MAMKFISPFKVLSSSSIKQGDNSSYVIPGFMVSTQYDDICKLLSHGIWFIVKITQNTTLPLLLFPMPFPPTS